MVLWVQQEGSAFLLEANSIGANAAEAAEILGQFDEFEAHAAVSGCGWCCNGIM